MGHGVKGVPHAPVQNGLLKRHDLPISIDVMDLVKRTRDRIWKRRWEEIHGAKADL